MPASKKDRKPRARTLYGRGLAIEEIAAELRVSESTISRWKAADERAGHSWDHEAPLDDLTDLRGVIDSLIKRLRKLARDEEMSSVTWADSLLKLLSSLEKTISLFGSTLQLMIAMDRFSKWFEAHLEGEELDLVRGTVNAFIAELREEASR